VQDKALQNGWKLLASDEQADYLYKAFPVKNFSAGLKLLGAAANLITKAGQGQASHLSLDSHTVTISLNYPAKSAPTDTHFTLAAAIDSIKP